MKRGPRFWILLCSIILLLIASLPFLLGLYSMKNMLMVLLLLIWPGAAFFSAFLMARAGVPWVLCVLTVGVFLLLPICVLMTPAGLRLLWPYPMLYALMMGAGLGIAYYTMARKAKNR